MLTCITCTKHSSGGDGARGSGLVASTTTLRHRMEEKDCDYGGNARTPSTWNAIKALTSQAEFNVMSVWNWQVLQIVFSFPLIRGSLLVFIGVGIRVCIYELRLNRSTEGLISVFSGQIKDMAIKASGAYKKCKACSGSSHSHRGKGNYADSQNASASARFRGYYLRNGSSRSTPRLWGKEMEARFKVFSSGETTPASVSGRTESAVFVLEDRPREWVALVEPGVVITFMSLPQGGNELRRIRFSQEMFSKWKAHRWWTENYDKVMELYNVQHSNQLGVPLATPITTEDEGSRVESVKASPNTPPLDKQWLPRNIQCPAARMGYSSSDSVENHRIMQSHPYCSSTGVVTAPKLSSIGVAKTETSSVDGSVSSGEEEALDSGELSMSNTSNEDSEWAEQDEPGVYITIRAQPNGTREIRRVRFSREKFGEAKARMWWEKNRARIQQQYL
ncbi:hypothetical protein MLD38_030257 [Melastoma candidum]|uniref:Uncharacterized protein n=1 Tax=Melastoma candidum TaxID=119954 RepID=A0ACB9ML70_9MYRT|nr:hypothetical protein MLD38_030257 [Melastoma candidum]